MTSITLIPKVSEKAYGQSQVEAGRTYAFVVPSSANKHSIARAVSSQYEVTVTEVRTVNVKGKAKQSYRKGSRPITGRRSDFKKAYVTLKAGDSLPIFAEVAAEEAQISEAEKKAAKKAEKESK